MCQHHNPKWPKYKTMYSIFIAYSWLPRFNVEVRTLLWHLLKALSNVKHWWKIYFYHSITIYEIICSFLSASHMCVSAQILFCEHLVIDMRTTASYPQGKVLRKGFIRYLDSMIVPSWTCTSLSGQVIELGSCLLFLTRFSVITWEMLEGEMSSLSVRLYTMWWERPLLTE